MASPKTVKLQAVLSPKSYEYWAIARMLDKGWENADLTRTIARDWLNSKRDDLKRDYGIDRDAWEQERGGNVRQIARGRKGKADGPAKPGAA